MTKTPEELTEDWKAGKLEYRQYWVKNKVWEKPFIDRWLPNCSWKISCKDAIEQILAPVPTYDEYKAMQEQIADASKKVEELEEKIKDKEELIQCLGSDIDYLNTKKMILIVENNKLRGLLKECKEWFECFAWNKEYKHKSVNILARINAAIDESGER